MEVPAEPYMCEMIRVPTQAEYAGHVMIGEPSPKFHARLVIVWPCAVLDDEAHQNTIAMPMIGSAGDEVKFAEGAGGVPTLTTLGADVVLWPT